MNPSTSYSFLASIESKTWVLLGIIAAFSYLFLSTAIQWYRLCHIPGPALASVTNWWCYRKTRSFNFGATASRLYDDYGKIVRILPNGIAISDPESIWRINSARSTYSRAFWYESIRLNPWGDTVLSEMDMSAHDKRKAKLIHGFSGKGLKDLETNVDLQLATLVDVLRKRIRGGQSILNIGTILQYFQVDLITQTGLGEAWGDLPLDKDHFDYIKKEEENQALVHSAAWVPLLRSVLFSPAFLTLFGPSVTSGWLGALHKAVEKRSNEKEHEGGHGVAMLDEWLKHGLPLSEAELDLAILLPAGTETSIYTIRALLLYLMVSPRVYHKLKSEITDAIRQGRVSSPIKNEEAKQLPYLQAVLYEGIRMAPAITIGFGKLVPAGGDVFHGKFVPAGTEVHTNFIGLMRDQEAFGDDVEVFRPERFIDCDAETQQRRMKIVNIIFGHGRWLCLGKVLAWLEMNKIFVELLKSFDFEVVDPEKPWLRQSTLTWYVDNFYARITECPVE